MTQSTIPNPEAPAQEKTFTRTKRLPPRQMRYRKSLLIERRGMKCFWCSCDLIPLTLTIDHLIPLSKGGSNKLKNLKAACRACNQARGDSMPTKVKNFHEHHKTKEQKSSFSDFLANNTNITISELLSLIPKMHSFRLIFAQMRIKALSEFTSNLISDLESEGFTFRDFLLALADWSENQSNNWQGAAYYLEQAASPPPSQPQHESPSEQSKAE